MSIGLALSLRNARLAAVVATIDAGDDPGRLMLYKGTRPATGGAPGAGDLLASLELANPSGSIDAAVLTFAAVANQTAGAAGIPTWARFVSSDYSQVLDADVGITGSGALVEMAEDPVNP